MKFRILFISLVLQLTVSIGYAQKTTVYTDVDAAYKKAMDLYEKEKYSTAQKEFERAISSSKDPNSETKMNAEFYRAMCALKLFNKDAEDLFIAFMEHNPHSPKIRQARYYLGINNYRKQNWPKTIDWFEQVNEHDLTEVELHEYTFKLGYAYLQKPDSAKAQVQFFTAKNQESEYKIPALFYYSHLEYKQGNIETALKGFEQLKEDKDFGGIVPYYIAQIYFLQKKYDDLIAYATPLLDSAKATRVMELNRLIGEGYYGLNKYDKALPYLKKYTEESGLAVTEEYYQLAYTYYKVKQYEPAIKYFQKVVDKQTATGQMALYYIGDSYMQINNKESARSAFRFASKANFDTIIAENSTFNYAKLSYELSIDPYHEAIYALEDFIKRFPNSARIDDARKYLLEVYLTTNDYKHALQEIDKIKNKGPELQYAYQRICYFHGVEKFNEEKLAIQKGVVKENFIEAIYYFNKSLTYSVDPKITAQCYYWKGEAFFKLDSLNKALVNYTKFLAAPAAANLPEVKEVYYNIGYVFFAEKDYQKSADAFRKYISENEKLKNKKVNDAYIKVADCYLLTKGYFTAAEFYNKAISLGLIKVDYALYNLSIAYGLLKKPGDKADALATLIYKYPQSVYADDAKFLLGDTYFKEGQHDKAVEFFRKAITDHPGNADLVQKSYVRLGLVYRSQNKTNEAIESFEMAIKENPSSSEVKTALELHKATCSDAGLADKHELFRESIGAPALSSYEKDTLNYNAAYVFYEKGDCDQSIKNFENYLVKFPNGFFTVDAQFYKAECQYEKALFDQALPAYEYVVSKPKNEHTEEALYKVAVLYKKQKNAAEVIRYYLALEEIAELPAYVYDAQVGLMREYALEANKEKAIEYTTKVLKNELATDLMKQEANLILARNYLSLFDWEKANSAYLLVTKGVENEMAVEAKYAMAYILYVQQKYDESIKEIYAFAKKFSNYKKWVTKGMLLLADNFIAKNDLFQAKYVLNTVVDNYKGEDLKQLAIDKLKEVEKLENPTKTEVTQPQETIIDFGNDTQTKELYQPETPENTKPNEIKNEEGKSHE